MCIASSSWADGCGHALCDGSLTVVCGVVMAWLEAALPGHLPESPSWGAHRPARPMCECGVCALFLIGDDASRSSVGGFSRPCALVTCLFLWVDDEPLWVPTCSLFINLGSAASQPVSEEGKEDVFWRNVSPCGPDPAELLSGSVLMKTGGAGREEWRCPGLTD